MQEAKEEQKKQIIDLYLQCKNSMEIANEVGLTDGRVRQIVNKFKNKEINKITLIPESLQLFNVWNFSSSENNCLNFCSW